MHRPGMLFRDMDKSADGDIVLTERQKTTVKSNAHVYEVRPHKDGRGFDLISDSLPFGRLWYLDAAAAVGYARFYLARTRQ